MRISILLVLILRSIYDVLHSIPSWINKGGNSTNIGIISLWITICSMVQWGTLLLYDLELYYNIHMLYIYILRAALLS